MKILYGVQATGNGHISRCRKMAAHFQARGADVTWVVSGRPRERLFDMECFGDFQWREGLTMSQNSGNVSYLSTVREASPGRFLRDVAQLDVSAYDVVVTDFEPITAWAARLRGKPCIGIGHQYAFGHRVPRARGNLLSDSVLRWFAPVDIPIGLHWHHFDTDILPPIIDPRLRRDLADEAFTLVYLPFEDQATVTALLQTFPERRFRQYSPDVTDGERGNVALRKTCLAGFRADLVRAQAVICNAGFELISECLHIGLPVLAKPVGRQVEQLSNAVALEQLGWGKIVRDLDRQLMAAWLDAQPSAPAVHYPDVAAALVDWLLDGDWSTQSALWETLWSCTREPSALAV